MDEELEFRVVSQPEESFCSSDLPPERPIFLVSNQSVELDRIKRSPYSVNEAGYIVLDSFRDILSLISLGHPPLADLSLLEVEPLLKDLIEING